MGVFLLHEILSSMKLELQHPKDNQDSFATYDIAIAAYLLCVGHEMVGFDRSNPKKVLFIFRKQENTQKEVDRYWDGQTFIDAQAFFNNLRRLKNQIHSG